MILKNIKELIEDVETVLLKKNSISQKEYKEIRQKYEEEEDYEY